MPACCPADHSCLANNKVDFGRKSKRHYTAMQAICMGIVSRMQGSSSGSPSSSRHSSCRPSSPSLLQDSLRRSVIVRAPFYQHVLCDAALGRGHDGPSLADSLDMQFTAKSCFAQSQRLQNFVGAASCRKMLGWVAVHESVLWANSPIWIEHALDGTGHLPGRSVAAPSRQRQGLSRLCRRVCTGCCSSAAHICCLPPGESSVSLSALADCSVFWIQILLSCASSQCTAG